MLIPKRKGGRNLRGLPRGVKIGQKMEILEKLFGQTLVKKWPRGGGRGADVACHVARIWPKFWKILKKVFVKICAKKWPRGNPRGGEGEDDSNFPKKSLITKHTTTRLRRCC
jgi:hypothetical protein